MRFFLVLLSLAFTACRSGPKSSDSDGPIVHAEGEQEQPESVEAKPMQSALLVADVASLPACDANNEGALAYVKIESSFQACLGGVWSVVVIKGEKGDKGDAGVAGKPGVDGIEKSVTGWFDQMTGNQWAVATEANASDAPSRCSGKYKLPTADQLIEASHHGLRTGLPSGLNTAWSSTVYEANPTGDATAVERIGSPGVQSVGAAKTLLSGVYCVEAAP